MPQSKISKRYLNEDSLIAITDNKPSETDFLKVIKPSMMMMLMMMMMMMLVNDDDDDYYRR
uniref:Bm8454 n=1 Tax=Brugia malayi TaxID=6279 RepID=A0A1I9G8F5_BRUMA|nr:Bm8454 [Brugia malayi]